MAARVVRRTMVMGQVGMLCCAWRLLYYRLCSYDPSDFPPLAMFGC